MPRLPNIGFRNEHPDPHTFPTTLTESQVFGVLAYGRQLQRLFRPAGFTGTFYVRGYIKDTIGRVYKSKKVRIQQAMDILLHILMKLKNLNMM